MSELEARLAKLAAQSETISYGALARALNLPGPGSIAQLTAALEALMDADAALGQPFRAALLCGRLNTSLPARGFFAKANALGRYDGCDPAAYVAQERQALCNFTLAQLSEHDGRLGHAAKVHECETPALPFGAETS